MADAEAHVEVHEEVSDDENSVDSQGSGDSDLGKGEDHAHSKFGHDGSHEAKASKVSKSSTRLDPEQRTSSLELVDKRKAGLGLMASVEARERDAREKRIVKRRRELLGKLIRNREFVDSLAAKLLAARNHLNAVKRSSGEDDADMDDPEERELGSDEDPWSDSDDEAGDWEGTPDFQPQSYGDLRLQRIAARQIELDKDIPHPKNALVPEIQLPTRGGGGGNKNNNSNDEVPPPLGAHWPLEPVPGGVGAMTVPRLLRPGVTIIREPSLLGGEDADGSRAVVTFTGVDGDDGQSKASLESLSPEGKLPPHVPLLNLAGDPDNAMKMRLDPATGQRYWFNRTTEESYSPKPRELESMLRGDAAEHAWLLRDKVARFEGGVAGGNFGNGAVAPAMAASSMEPLRTRAERNKRAMLRWQAMAPKGRALAPHLKGKGWRALPRAHVPRTFLKAMDVTATVDRRKGGPRDRGFTGGWAAMAPSSMELCEPVLVGLWDNREETGYVEPSFAEPYQALFVEGTEKDGLNAESLARAEREKRRAAMSTAMAKELTIKQMVEQRNADGGITEFTSQDRWLDKQAEEDAITTNTYVTQIITAVKNGDLGEVENILDDHEDVKVDSEDEHGSTLLILAVQQGDRRLAKYFLRRRANINHQNHAGNTCLHFAFEYNHADLGNYLIEKGADPGLVNAQGLTCYEGLNSDAVDAI